MTKNKALWDALTVWEYNNTSHSLKMPQRAPGQSREVYKHNSNRAKAIKSSLRREKGAKGGYEWITFTEQSSWYKKQPYKCQGTLI